MRAQDVRLILPTLFILLFTVLIMLTVIPYAFASVIRQMAAVESLTARTANITNTNLTLSSSLPDNITLNLPDF